MSGHMEHDPYCKEPINEHTGNEPCIRWVEDEAPKVIPIAHYKQGPQGNIIADYEADYRARSQPWDRTRPLGSLGIADRRDTSDPTEVGEAHFARKTTAYLNGT